MAHDRVVCQGLVVTGLGRHVLAQDVHPLLDGREGEHGEPLEVQRLGDVLEPPVHLADDVVVGDPHLVEEHVVGALVPHGPDRVDGDAGLVEGDEKERDPSVLGRVRVGAGAHPVPLGEVGRGRPGLLTVEAPAVAVPRGPQLHRRRVRAGIGLAVADGELDLVAKDLGQELPLQPVVPMGQDRLADDPDALADLRSSPTGQGLVEEVLVHAIALLASPLLGPGDPEPTALADLAHELTLLRRVDDLGHVLPRDVEHLGIVVLVEEALDLLPEGDLLGRELEVHVPPGPLEI